MYWTLERYDNVVIFEVPNEKVAMNVILKRADRMDKKKLSLPCRLTRRVLPGRYEREN